MKMKELAKALGIKSSQYARFRSIVKELIERGELVKLKRGRIGVASEMDVSVGVLSVTRSGVGYVIVEGRDDDIYVPAVRLHTALDGDKVMVRLGSMIGDRQGGTIIKVLERAQRNIVGIFHTSGSFNFISPVNKKMHRDIYIPDKKIQGAKEGQKVVAVLTLWEDPYLNPEGEITEVLGYPHQAGVDILTIIKSYDLPEEFPDDVINEAEQASAKLSHEEMDRREDLTDSCLYTIDPADAKDHDDAVSVEKIDIGYRLGVHIADVSYYVDENSQLDKEALARGNSVYLPGTVIPMLPEILSNDVCSLKVNKKRLAHSVFIDIDHNGAMKAWRFADTVIKSKAKLSYEDVQEFFDNGTAPPKVTRVSKNLQAARELARLLTKKRFRDGSLDFDLPESVIVFDTKGEVIDLTHKIRLESHRLVEEFMLLANQAVALEVFRKAQPFLYRVHARPDIDKLTDFASLMKRLGYKFSVSPNIAPKVIARFLDSVKNAPEAEFINELLLRSMQKAVYQRENIGHFGLAFKHYTHFTSPIRRYPDLIVHRLLRKIRGKGRYAPSYAKKVSGYIDRVSTHCSETERHAEQAERDAVKMKQMAFMSKHIGEEYTGVISGVMSFGFFVRLDKLGVEGLVRMSTIDDDYYHYDEKQYRIIGRRTNKVYQLGDKVKIGVLNVDKINAEMDLFVVKEQKQKKSGKNQHPAKKKHRKKPKRKKS